MNKMSWLKKLYYYNLNWRKIKENEENEKKTATKKNLTHKNGKYINKEYRTVVNKI